MNLFKEWKSFSIGDESRDRPIINHPRHYELGFLEHKKVLSFLDQPKIIKEPWKVTKGKTLEEWVLILPLD